MPESSLYPPILTKLGVHGQNHEVAQPCLAKPSIGGSAPVKIELKIYM